MVVEADDDDKVFLHGIYVNLKTYDMFCFLHIVSQMLHLRSTSQFPTTPQTRDPHSHVLFSQ